MSVLRISGVEKAQGRGKRGASSAVSLSDDEIGLFQQTEYPFGYFFLSSLEYCIEVGYLIYKVLSRVIYIITINREQRTNLFSRID